MPILELSWVYLAFILFVETSSGRQRLNVLGALNAVTKKMITVINTTYINAWSVVELMRKIREAHPEGKIVLVMKVKEK